MRPYQIAGVLSGCAAAFAVIVGVLAVHGMPVMLAFLMVYAIALLTMLAMQRRARQTWNQEREPDACDEIGC